MKNIERADKQQNQEKYTVLFTDGTTRTYKVQYTQSGRGFIKVYGKRVYDVNGRAI